MMYLRRAIALILALIFLLLFIPLILIFRVNATVGNSGFYINQLRNNDIYNFTYDDVLPAAIDELKADTELPAEIISLIEPRILPLVEQALPRGWVQEQVEQVLRKSISYFLGASDDLNIVITLRERTEEILVAIKDLVSDEEFFNELYCEGIDYYFDENQTSFQDLPFTVEDLKDAIENVLPPQWISQQISRAIDEMTPYLTGEQDEFNIHVNFSDRLDAAESVAVDLLGSQTTYDYVMDELVRPIIKDGVSDIVELPVGTTLIVGEVMDAVEHALTLEWYRGEIDSAVVQVFAYLRGETEKLEIYIDLEGRKPIIVEELVPVVIKKLVNYFNDDVLLTVTEHVDTWIPDRLSLDEVLAQVSEDINVEEALTGVRDDINAGIGYTDADLRSDLEDIEDIREKISIGYVFTEQDLRNLLEEDNSETLETLDNARSVLGKVRRWMWVAWIIPILLLVASGALGARKWTNKLIWGASILAVTSFIVIILSWPVFSTLGRPQINDALTESISQTQGLENLIVEKLVSLSQSSIDTFIRGLLIQGIILLVISLAVIGFAIYWNRFRGNGELEALPVENTDQDNQSGSEQMPP